MVLDRRDLGGDRVVGCDADRGGDARRTHASPVDVSVRDRGPVVVAVGLGDPAGAAVGAMAAVAVAEGSAVAGAWSSACVPSAGGSICEPVATRALRGIVVAEILQSAAGFGDFVRMHFAGGVPAGIEREAGAAGDGGGAARRATVESTTGRAAASDRAALSV